MASTPAPAAARNPHQRHLKRLSLSTAVFHSAPHSLSLLAASDDSPPPSAPPLADDVPFASPARSPLCRTGSGRRRPSPMAMAASAGSSPSPSTPRTPSGFGGHVRRQSSIAYRHSLDGGGDSPRLSSLAGFEGAPDAAAHAPSPIVDEFADTSVTDEASVRRSRPSSIIMPSVVEETTPAKPAIPPSPMEQHGDLLTFIAMKERKCLDLRQELAKHESELETLKKKYQALAARTMSQVTPAHSAPASASSSTLSFSSTVSRALSSASTPNRHSLTSSSAYDVSTSPFLSPPDLFFDPSSSTTSPSATALGIDPESATAAVNSAKKYLGGIGKGILDFLQDGSTSLPSSPSPMNSSLPSSSSPQSMFYAPGVPTGLDTSSLDVVQEEEEDESSSHQRRASHNTASGSPRTATTRPSHRARDGSVSSSSDSAASSSSDSSRSGHRSESTGGRPSSDGSDVTTVEDCQTTSTSTTAEGEKTPTPSGHRRCEDEVDHFSCNEKKSTTPMMNGNGLGLSSSNRRELTRALSNSNSSVKKHDRRRSTFDLVSSTAGIWSGSLGKKIGEFTNSDAFKSSKKATLTFVEGFERTLTEVITIDQSITSPSTNSSLTYSQHPFYSSSQPPVSASLDRSMSSQGVFSRKARERATMKPKDHQLVDVGEIDCQDNDKDGQGVEQQGSTEVDTWAW